MLDDAGLNVRGDLVAGCGSRVFPVRLSDQCKTRLDTFRFQDLRGLHELAHAFRRLQEHDREPRALARRERHARREALQIRDLRLGELGELHGGAITGADHPLVQLTRSLPASGPSTSTTGPLRKPSWLKVRPPGGPNYAQLKTMMRELDIKPELEIYDSGHLDVVHTLIAENLLELPITCSLVLGVQGGMGATPAPLGGPA